LKNHILTIRRTGGYQTGLAPRECSEALGLLLNRAPTMTHFYVSESVLQPVSDFAASISPRIVFVTVTRDCGKDLQSMIRATHTCERQSENSARNVTRAAHSG
jgi:hypothetical protein